MSEYFFMLNVKYEEPEATASPCFQVNPTICKTNSSIKIPNTPKSTTHTAENQNIDILLMWPYIRKQKLAKIEIINLLHDIYYEIKCLKILSLVSNM